NKKLEDSHPKDVLDEVTKLIPGISISFSGAEDVVLIDLASKLDPTPPVFTLDTGRLHPETYHFIESVRQPSYRFTACNSRGKSSQ
ncbi:MAG: phosphoadenosine phosphosulfate reductase family protein, partial [Pseudomonadota bacterium]|nr:phosphoadenosine phosphosulfate reductase family protein [Pseudomonadota bacterium]